jgi:NAD(P)H-nitrite reductase large subunit
MAGEGIRYEGSVGLNSIEFFGLPVVSLGIYKSKPGDAAFKELKIHRPHENIYRKLILKNNVLVGALLVGEIKNSGVFLRLIRERIDVSDFQDKLLNDNFSYPEIMQVLKSKENIYV